MTDPDHMGALIIVEHWPNGESEDLVHSLYADWTPYDFMMESMGERITSLEDGRAANCVTENIIMAYYPDLPSLSLTEEDERFYLEAARHQREQADG